ncbi:hypothetical protein [Microbacterium sp. WCS2018Hpa-9]|uniref:hypothetical protein n=1 Tax=Microbacterium sp. WCS2018Hpa-9 TaxID=3073635 RepID=UPI00288B6CD6|nr:hypothetical protein [Microbacterium sp. WCS2018Hpa-9]
MRRKKLVERDPITAESLAASALQPAPIDDVMMPYPLRKKAFERWMDKRTAWVERREVYALEYGWPGGDYARHVEENEAHPIPAAPFDPEWEIRHGDL